jgi:hypothetical protein
MKTIKKGEKMKKLLVAFLFAGFSSAVLAQDAAAPEAAPAAEKKMQTKCICGMELVADKKIAVDAEGVKIYACSEACAEKVKADPKSAIETIKAAGEEVEALPAEAAAAVTEAAAPAKTE